MPSSEDSVRLRHMLDAARRAVQFAQGRDRADLDGDLMFSLAMVRLLEIIGEASKYVAEEFRQSTPQIPWKQIGGTRDRLIHGYFDVDLDIVWTIVTNDLPVLVQELEKVISHDT